MRTPNLTPNKSTDNQPQYFLVFCTDQTVVEEPLRFIKLRAILNKRKIDPLPVKKNLKSSVRMQLQTPRSAFLLFPSVFSTRTKGFFGDIKK